MLGYSSPQSNFAVRFEHIFEGGAALAASVSLLPGATAAAKRPLSDRRQALDRAIVLKAAAQKAVETAAEPVRRCDVIITKVARLRAELAELYQRDQRLTGEWIAGGRIGPDPGDAKDTATLNSRIVAIQACRPAAARAAAHFVKACAN